ncbi:MAG: response regulator [Anaerolineae bacterium]|nr:response regulator [Anaerolineae bacterium]
MSRILYIEDEFTNRLLIKRVLEAQGHVVFEAESGTSGLQMAQTCNPDLILMDINLPDIDGYECTARLRKMPDFNTLPIIALTANAMVGDADKALAAGCDGYISKPIDVDTLPRQVMNFINTRSSKGIPLRDSPLSGGAGRLPGRDRRTT